MINIQNAVKVPYNQGANFLTVYFDFDNPNLMYAVPVPRIATDAQGNPAMTVTKYITNDIASYGYLNMDVEVEVPTEARLAAENQFPDKNWGQFQWVASECYLSFTLPSQPDGGILQGQPSLYGTNRANFNLNIRSAEDLNAIMGAFRGHPVSSFQMEYDMTTLTKLNGVTATVSFNAEVAIEFETIYKNEKDIWGNSQRVASGVKKNLQVSKAGDVKIDWNIPDPSPEFQSRVNEWAWTTLEKAVADAVDTAQAAATSSDPIKSLDSFEQTYTENSVIEWNIISSFPLAGFTTSDWDSKIYHEVDNRNLVVNFALKGELLREDGTNVCKEVQVVVKYPTKTTGNTFALIPMANDHSLYTYTAPGYINPVTGSFDPNYEYSYTVIYSDTDKYTSGWKKSDQTSINIIPNELGAKKVTFVGSNIPFGDEPTQVKKVRIDFFFERPNGDVNQTLIGELLSNGGEGQVFQSYYSVPLTNTYTYRFIYELNDGTVKVMNTIADFGQVNSNLYMVQSLLKEHEFTLRASRIKDVASVDFVYLAVSYNDVQNKDRVDHSFDWEVDWSGSSRSTRDTKWKFAALDNPKGAYYELNGDYEISTGNIIEVTNVFQQADNGTFRIEPGFAYYGIKVIPTNIDWNAVAEVNVILFQRPINRFLSDEDATEVVKGFKDNTRGATDEATFNVNFVTFLPPDSSTPNVDRYYVVMKALDQPNLEFYYNATYVQKVGAPLDSGEIELINKSSLVLPSNGKPEIELIMHKCSVEAATSKKRSSKKEGSKVSA